MASFRNYINSLPEPYLQAAQELAADSRYRKYDEADRGFFWRTLISADDDARNGIVGGWLEKMRTIMCIVRNPQFAWKRSERDDLDWLASRHKKRAPPPVEYDTSDVTQRARDALAAISARRPQSRRCWCESCAR